MGLFRMMSRRSALVAAFALAAFTGVAADAGAKEWKTIRIGSEGAYPPFNFIDSNQQLQGFDIEITKAICANLKVECTFVAQDWDGMIPALLANKYDAIAASMSITEERQKVIGFSNKYYATPASFIANKSAGALGSTPEALKGKTLGAQSATVSATYLEDVYGKAGAEVKLYATQDEANLDLASGRLDAILADKTVLLEWLDKSDAGKCCQFIGQDIRDEKYFGAGIGFGLRKQDAELKSLLDKGIEAIRADGTYEKINAKYFPFAVY